MAIVAATSTSFVASSVSYVKAVTTSSYVKAKMIAEITFPDLINVDIVTPTDLVTLTTYKVEQDSVNTLEQAVKAFVKKATDSITGTDVISKKAFGKVLNDAQSISEIKSVSFLKKLIDSTNSSDIVSLAPLKVLADSFSLPTEVVSKAFTKSINDSVSLSDVVTAFKIYIRSYSDSLNTPDSVSLLDTPATKTDLASTSDNNTLATSKNLNDGLNLHDDMDGILDFAFVKAVSDLLASSDSKAIVFTGQKADNIATSSSGILSMQDYCDITYFLEDYVGTSRIFT